MIERPRILVIDDDPALQKLVTTLLEYAGMESVIALNATEGVNVLRQRPLPDLILLDMMLPDVDGLEFLRQMREKKLFDHIPVIILSALADPDRIRDGLSMGADRYITKPYIANNLVRTVNEVLRTGRKIPTA